jgi:hypothetical protein
MTLTPLHERRNGHTTYIVRSAPRDFDHDFHRRVQTYQIVPLLAAAGFVWLALIVTVVLLWNGVQALWHLLGIGGS